MKVNFYARWKFFLPLYLASSALFGENLFPFQDKNPPAGYYVVVAAYYANGINYAEKYASSFEEKGFNGQYAFFPEKQMYMVHLNRYTDFNEAIGVMKNVRKEGIKDDAWVFVYRPEDIPLIKESEPSTSITDKTDPSPLEESASTTKPEPPSDIPTPAVNSEPEAEPNFAEASVDEPETNPYEGMFPVYFNLFQAVNLEPVHGLIQIVDPEKARIITNLNANEWHHINKPSSTHEEIQLEADFFGYRKIIQVIHLDDPQKDSTDYYVTVKGDSILVDFELVRYHRGDIFTMYNVYFITHSAIMRQESIYELDQLLAMFEENPNLEIILHGHTNGNSKGDMRYKPEGDSDFFSTTGALEKSASAKELSQERAKVVKRYLVDKGISPSRIQIKGWGGKRMLYKKTDPQAIKNVRVEIEIVNE